MDPVRRLRGVLREPLLHFVLIGAGLFVLHGWLNDTGVLSTQAIVIDEGRVEQLAVGFAALHQRAPTQDELQALVDDAVKEEIFYREAVAQGLDQDDVIVRRRMRQKLEFLSEDIAPVSEPTDVQLQAWLDAHPGEFVVAPRYTFEQVFLDPSRHGASLPSVAAALRQRLDDGQNAARAGDPLLLPRRFEGASAVDVRAQFGERFATTLATLAPGTWQGPIRSGYGVHLVRLVQRQAGHAPPLEDVREDVRREWTQAQRDIANARFYATLRKRYDVRISFPAPSALTANAVAEVRQP